MRPRGASFGAEVVGLCIFAIHGVKVWRCRRVSAFGEVDLTADVWDVFSLHYQMFSNDSQELNFEFKILKPLWEI